MNFIPEAEPAKSVPYFDDVSSKDGWQGHETSKSIERLQDEIAQAVRRLGGSVINFQAGQFVTGDRRRDGFRMRYVLHESGAFGQMNIAALPIKTGYQYRSTEKKRRDRSLRMALYMLNITLNGLWFLQQLSPGFAPLMPWMLVDQNHTVTELWSESKPMRNLLPPAESEFVEGEYREA